MQGLLTLLAYSFPALLSGGCNAPQVPHSSVAMFFYTCIGILAIMVFVRRKRGDEFTRGAKVK